MEGLGPGETVDVLLAVPQLQIGRANAGGPGDPGGALPRRGRPRAGPRREHRPVPQPRRDAAAQRPAADRRPDHRRVRDDPGRPGRAVQPGRGAAAGPPVVHPAGAGLRRLAAAVRGGHRRGVQPRRRAGQAARQAGPRPEHPVRLERPRAAEDLRAAADPERGVRGVRGDRPGGRGPPVRRLPGVVPAGRQAGGVRQERDAARRPAGVRPRRPGEVLLHRQAVHRRPADAGLQPGVRDAAVRRRRAADAGADRAELAGPGLSGAGRGRVGAGRRRVRQAA